jgi:two-component system nitrate/nitrite response regulator NarL
MGIDMLHRLAASAFMPSMRLDILIISAVRIFGDCLRETLVQADFVASCECCTDPSKVLPKLLHGRPDVVLLDAAHRKGHDFICSIRRNSPETKVVVVAVAEDPEDIIFWVEAGAEGFIPAGVAAHEIIPLLLDILRGDQACTAHVAGGLLRRLCEVTRSGGTRSPDQSDPVLTKRELQVLELVCVGMSNKEIARCLDIEVTTTKSHVHNVLTKLSIQKRSQAVVRMREYRMRLGAPTHVPSP